MRKGRAVLFLSVVATFKAIEIALKQCLYERCLIVYIYIFDSQKRRDHYSHVNDEKTNIFDFFCFSFSVSA